MAFDHLLSVLNLEDEYYSYIESCRDLFSGLAEAAPVLVKKKLVLQSAQDLATPEYSLKCAGKGDEQAVMSYFIELYDNMVRAASTVENAPNAHYLLRDHQSVPVLGTRHKPDGAFCYSRDAPDMATVHAAVEAKISSAPMTASHKDFGQVADYACAMWEKQPTRTFAPVIFLHGMRASLVLFTRGKWYTVDLGCLLHSKQTPNSVDVCTVHTTMMKLWFFLTLTPDRFGHFCDVRLAASPIRFTHTAGTVMATASVPKPVLKLAWTQTNRLPESAVYDILVAKGVAGIPDVYDRGLLKTDFFGFRLEYLVLEDCGDTLDVCLDKLAKRGASNKDLAEQLSSTVEVVAGCIVAARAAGVLHRDVSLGNVAVSNGRARLLDWGCGKVVESSGMVKETAKRWMFDAQEVMANEAGHDPLTGTVHYTGIRVLLEAKTRGYLDDIESLFYVALHAVSRLENGLNTYEGKGHKFLDNDSLALARVALLGLESNYHKYFGIIKYRDTFRSTLDAMQKFLFWSPSGYTGLQLMDDMEYDRPVDIGIAAKLMNEDGLKVLGQLLAGSDEGPGQLASGDAETGQSTGQVAVLTNNDGLEVPGQLLAGSDAGPGQPTGDDAETGQVAGLKRRSDDAPQPHAAMSTTSEPVMTRAAAKKAKTAGKKTEPVNKKPKTTNKENDA
ncbi:hypothetical protein IWQ57_000561 [Coemansia nantahalensis]|uniref:Uncharacterized protein n=1 Tax=Coemansia nantahalensis TaxID=2789366 RepID=A0ACC1K761_9FUNG|nr:hypothetical protein IWQ57_000561 [Coemansia nantahalensis]